MARSADNTSGLGAVSSTLVAPLYYRAVESRRPGGMLDDRRAVELIGRLDYDFGWLDDQSLTQVLTVMRARELDGIARRFLAERPRGIVVDLGCGLDFRFDRIDDGACDWYGVDVPDVIALRRRLVGEEPARSHLIACSAMDPAWCDQIDRGDRPILVIAEGLIVYLSEAEARSLVLMLRSRFPGAELAFDALPRAQIYLFSLHPVLRKTGARLGWTPGEDDELERWAPGIRLLSRWCYFDKPERRLGPARLIRYIPSLGSGSRILRYRLD